MYQLLSTKHFKNRGRHQKIDEDTKKLKSDELNVSPALLTNNNLIFRFFFNASYF